MTASPDQRLTADHRRGYSKDYLNQLCTCGCTRAVHASRTGACLCQCEGFSMAAAHAQPATAVSVERNYSFGTVPLQDPVTRLPDTLREIPEPADISTHETLTESGIMRAVAMDEAANEPVVLLDEPIVVPREGTASRCPFCLANDFESVPAVKCPSCKAWQHAACVREAGRCAACNAAWPV